MERIYDKFLKYLNKKLENIFPDIPLLRGRVLKDKQQLSREAFPVLNNPILYQQYDLIKSWIGDIIRIRDMDDTYAEIYDKKSFPELSFLLESSPLYDDEKAQLMLSFLEYNIRTITRVNSTTPMTIMLDYDSAMLDTFAPKYFTKKQFSHFIRTAECNTLLLTEDELLDKDSLNKKKEIQYFMRIACFSVQDTISKNLKIKEHYFDKSDTYDVNDISIIMDILLTMGISDNICDCIRRQLLSQYKGRKHHKSSSGAQDSSNKNQFNPTPKEEILKEEVQQETPKENQLSKKEYCQIARKIRGYFNLGEMKAFRYLSIDEITELIQLLDSIGVNYEDIEKILKIVEKENRTYSVHAMVQYNEYYKKLEFYKLNDDLKEYFQQSFIADDEEYEICKEVIKEDLYKLCGTVIEREFHRIMDCVNDIHDFSRQKVKFKQE